MHLKDILYTFIVFGIKCYKWIEGQILWLFDAKVQREYHALMTKCGIVINGDKPWDLQVKNPKFYNKVANLGALGFSEAYLDRWIDAERIDECMNKMMRNEATKYYWTPINRFLNFLEFRLFNMQTIDKAFEVGEHHYDLGNDLYEACFDPMINYSAAYWPNADNLTQAQVNKLDLIARKLLLEPGMKVLDIGCGWGAMAKYLAQNYKVKVVGITVSVEGAAFAKETCAGLDIEIRIGDYRELREKFDRIYSIEMIEHVGPKNYREYFQVVNRCLRDDGLFVMHCTGNNDPWLPSTEPFTQYYVFKNIHIPYYLDVMKATEGLFIVEDWHNLGSDFDYTAMAWLNNFNRNWDKISAKYGEKFKRFWTFYLSCVAALARSRQVQVWHFVFSKNGVDGRYTYQR